MISQNRFYFKNLNGFKKIGLVILVYQFFLAGFFSVYILQINQSIQESCIQNNPFDDILYYNSNELELNEENCNQIINSINSVNLLQSDSFFYFDLNVDNKTSLETIRFISLPESLNILKEIYPSLFNFSLNITTDSLSNFNYFTFQNVQTTSDFIQSFNFSGQISSYENFSIEGKLFHIFPENQKQNVSLIFKTIYSPHFFHISNYVKYIFVNLNEFLRITKNTSLKLNGLSIFSIKLSEINLFSSNTLNQIFFTPSSILYSPYKEVSYYYLFENGIHSNFNKDFYINKFQINQTFQILFISVSLLYFFYHMKTMDEILQKNIPFFRKIVILGDDGINHWKINYEIILKSYISMIPVTLISDCCSLLFFSLSVFNLQNSLSLLLKIIVIKDILLLILILILNSLQFYLFKLKFRYLFSKHIMQQNYLFNNLKFKIQPFTKLFLMFFLIFLNFIIMHFNFIYFIKNGFNNSILENFILNYLPFLSTIFFSAIISSLLFSDFSSKIDNISYNIVLKLGCWYDSEKILMKYWTKRRNIAKINVFYVVILISLISFVGFLGYQERFFINDKMLDLIYPAKNFLQYSKIIQFFALIVFILLKKEFFEKENNSFNSDILKKYSDFGADIKRIIKMKRVFDILKSLIIDFILIFSSVFICLIQLFSISVIYFKRFSSVIQRNFLSFNFFFSKTFIFFVILSNFLIIYGFYIKNKKN
ncbi:hypothetical protein [Candidatus Harpocratesius sp.]